MSIKQSIIIKYCLIVVTALMGFWILGDLIFFSNKPLRPFYTYEVIISFSLFIVLLVLTLLFLIKFIKYKPNYITLGVLSIVFLILFIRLLVIQPQTFNIVAPTSNVAYEFTSSLTPDERFKYIVKLFITFVFGFIILDILPKTIEKKELKYLLMALLVIIYGLIVVSYFVDFKSYIHLITFSNNNGIYEDSIKSVFPHKTVFGYILMIGGFIALYLFALEKKWYWLANVGIIFIHLLFTISKLAIIIFFVAVVGYLVYLFIATYKDNPKRNKMILIICLSVIAAILLLVLALYLASPKVKEIINKIIFPSGYSTLTTRVWIWNYCFAILKQTSFSLGAGFIYFGSVLKQANLMDPETAIVNNTAQAHNSYISMLGNGGLLLLVLYVLLITLIIKNVVKTCKTDLNFGIFFGICLLALLVYGIFEAAPVVLATSADHILGGGFVVVGLLIHNQASKEN